jgi:hypothetical protein
MSKKAMKKSQPKKPSPRAKRTITTEAFAPEISNEIVNGAAAPSLDQIRDRAYQIFRTGANPRDPVADWFQAERELNGYARA